MQYFPGIFAVPDLDAARRIILTDEGPGADTDSRWAAETPYLLELIGTTLAIGPETTLLDYGCGIGRMAKGLIETTGCIVIGVDISPQMRALATDYVNSSRFMAVAPAQLDIMVRAGLRVGAAIAIWVLQHCLTPAEDIARLAASLAPEGQAFILNMPSRAIPVLDGEGSFRWANDGQDIATLLRAVLTITAQGTPDPARTPNMGDVGAFWMTLRPS